MWPTEPTASQAAKMDPEAVMAAADFLARNVKWALTAYIEPFDDSAVSWWFRTKAQAEKFRKDMKALHVESGKRVHWVLSQVVVSTPDTFLPRWRAGMAALYPEDCVPQEQRNRLAWLDGYRPRATDPGEAEELGLQVGALIPPRSEHPDSRLDR